MNKSDCLTGSKYHTNRSLTEILKKVCAKNKHIKEDVLRQIIVLAVEISREGREGRKIGTMFIVGDEKKVLKLSRTIILDPLKGHSTEEKRIQDPNLRETVKELAQLDGAFIVSEDGVVISAASYIIADSKNIDVPLGLGSRHIAAASVTQKTNAAAVVVSESSVVRIVVCGKIISEIIPELWLIQRTRQNEKEYKT